jgi:hypothetical protein
VKGCKHSDVREVSYSHPCSSESLSSTNPLRHHHHLRAAMAPRPRPYESGYTRADNLDEPHFQVQLRIVVARFRDLSLGGPASNVADSNQQALIKAAPPPQRKVPSHKQGPVPTAPKAMLALPPPKQRQALQKRGPVPTAPKAMLALPAPKQRQALQLREPLGGLENQRERGFQREKEYKLQRKPQPKWGPHGEDRKAWEARCARWNRWRTQDERKGYIKTLIDSDGRGITTFWQEGDGTVWESWRPIYRKV